MNKEQKTSQPTDIQKLKHSDVGCRYYIGLVDMNTNKPLEDGHIVAVRYIWNSYVGEINIKLNFLWATGAKHFAFFFPNSLKNTATYQIIGHTNKEHPDYNDDVLNWYKSETLNCPIKLTIYDNCEHIDL